MSETLALPQHTNDGQHLLRLYKDLWLDTEVLDRMYDRQEPESAYEALFNTISVADTRLPDSERMAEIGRGAVRRLEIMEYHRDRIAQIESRTIERRSRITAFLEEHADQTVTVRRRYKVADMSNYRGGQTHTITGAILSPSHARYGYLDFEGDNHFILWKTSKLSRKQQFANVLLRFPGNLDAIVDIDFET